MTMALIQKGDGTTKTMMLTENINATYWGYFNGIDRVTDEDAVDSKVQFGFCWEQPNTVVDALTQTFDPNAKETDARYRRLNGLKEPLPSTDMANLTENYGFPSSYHPGGVQVAFMGGQVDFVNEQIDNLVYAQLMTTDHKKSQLKDADGSLFERDPNVQQPQDDAF